MVSCFGTSFGDDSACPAGYFSRVLALRQLLQDFHVHFTSQGVTTVQILSLGAGFDTSFFNLQVRLLP